MKIDLSQIPSVGSPSICRANDQIFNPILRLPNRIVVSFLFDMLLARMYYIANLIFNYLA